MSKNIRTWQPSLGDFTWYSVNTFCGNCCKHSHAWVKKGVRKKGLTIVCDNCGCTIKLP